MAWGPGLNREEKASWAGSTHLCLCWTVNSEISCLKLLLPCHPHHNGVYLQTESQINPSFSYTIPCHINKKSNGLHAGRVCSVLQLLQGEHVQEWCSHSHEPADPWALPGISPAAHLTLAGLKAVSKPRWQSLESKWYPTATELPTKASIVCKQNHHPTPLTTMPSPSSDQISLQEVSGFFHRPSFPFTHLLFPPTLAQTHEVFLLCQIHQVTSNWISRETWFSLVGKSKNNIKHSNGIAMEGGLASFISLRGWGVFALCFCGIGAQNQSPPPEPSPKLFWVLLQGTEVTTTPKIKMSHW